MTVQVTVYHNCTRDERGRSTAYLDGYQPGNPVTAVARFESLLGDDKDAYFRVLEHVWFLFNVGHDPDFGIPDPVAVHYRLAKNRSLCVGDVVRIGDEWFACGEAGWSPIAEPQVSVISLHGTAPLAGG